MSNTVHLDRSVITIQVDADRGHAKRNIGIVLHQIGTAHHHSADRLIQVRRALGGVLRGGGGARGGTSSHLPSGGPGGLLGLLDRGFLLGLGGGLALLGLLHGAHDGAELLL